MRIETKIEFYSNYMKFYESHYEDYIASVEKSNMHPELISIYNKISNNRLNLENLIFYGPTGTGKYSQVLYLLKNLLKKYC